jgi:hypothetical protein
MKFIDIIKYLFIPKALTHSVESDIIRLFRSDKNESSIICTRFRLGNLLRAFVSALNKIFWYIRLSNNPDKTNTIFFQSHFYTVSRLNDRKNFYTKNEYFIQNETSLFFHSF